MCGLGIVSNILRYHILVLSHTLNGVQYFLSWSHTIICQVTQNEVHHLQAISYQILKINNIQAIYDNHCFVANRIQQSMILKCLAKTNICNCAIVKLAKLPNLKFCIINGKTLKKISLSNLGRNSMFDTSPKWQPNRVTQHGVTTSYN